MTVCNFSNGCLKILILAFLLIQFVAKKRIVIIKIVINLYMKLEILSKLIKLINPSKIYTYEFNEILETKTGKDWRGTFISESKQITDSDGQKLIEHFETPKENHKINKTKK